MDLQTSKNLGGVGALLLFIGPLLTLVHSIGGLTSLIGFILLLIALKGFADHYNDTGIFNNALYGFITTIIGVVVAGGVFFVTALNTVADLASDLGIVDWTNIAEWTATVDWTSQVVIDAMFTLITGIVVAAVVLFVFVIITAWLYRRSLGILSTKSGVGLFGTAGLLLLVGAVLTIIFVGFLLMWISFLIIAIAFFQIKPTAAEPPPSPPPP
jgi:uncharacterized membrane protein